jgi:hypothetical protein
MERAHPWVSAGESTAPLPIMTSPARAKLAAVAARGRVSPRKLRLGLWEIYLCPKKKYSSEPDIKNGQQLSVELKIIRL